MDLVFDKGAMAEKNGQGMHPHYRCAVAIWLWVKTNGPILG